MLRRPGVDGFFGRRQQIDQQGGETAALEGARDKLIPRAVAATSTPVRKQHQSMRRWRRAKRGPQCGCRAGDREIAIQPVIGNRHSDSYRLA